MIRVATMTVLAMSMFAGSCAIARAEPSNETLTGREALESLGRLDWYDSETGEPKPILVESSDAESTDTRNRLDGFEEVSQGTGNTFFDFSGFLEVFGWGVITVLGILLVVAIVAALLSGERNRRLGRAAANDAVTELSETAERMERLPVDVRRPSSNLLEEARVLMEAGKYNEAIVYLFSHQLVQLDKHQFLRLSRGKTNRQYLRELHQAAVLRDVLQRTVSVFEDAFFGNHQISRERFAICWNDLERFQSALSNNLSGRANR